MITTTAPTVLSREAAVDCEHVSIKFSMEEQPENSTRQGEKERRNREQFSQSQKEKAREREKGGQ
jgi:hypothetical protein